MILSANSSDGNSLSIIAGLLWYIMAGLLWSGNFGEQLLSAEAGSAEFILPFLKVLPKEEAAQPARNPADLGWR